MNVRTLTAVCLLIFGITTAQNDDAQIYQVLHNYIEGTAHTQPNLLRKAFSESTSLYFTKNNELWQPPVSEYIGYFEKQPAGTPTGRMGRILSIDRTNDVAIAKVEIAIPEGKRAFTDYFILKKHNDTWEIMSKTATSAKSNVHGRNILFVVSNAHFYGNSDINTANHFAEIVLAYDEFKKAGYAIDFVSPEGGAVPLGYIQTSEAIIKQYLYDADFMFLLKNTQKPSETKASHYEAVYYVGGGAAMFGVPENKGIQDIAMAIYETHGGIISAVCHGSAGLANLQTKTGAYLVADKRVNGFPDKFENMERDYYATFPFSIEKKLKERGATFNYSKKGWDNYFEIDGRLITGQDPSAAASVAKEVIAALQK